MTSKYSSITLSTTFYYLNQIILNMAILPKFCNSSVSMKEVIINLALQEFDRRLFEGWCCFKFSNLGVELGIAFKFDAVWPKG